MGRAGAERRDPRRSARRAELRIAAQVLSHDAPEQRLAGLAPEQRLAGLDSDHQALALPIELLCLLPEEYLRSLSPDVEAEIRRRLGQNNHGSISSSRAL